MCPQTPDNATHVLLPVRYLVYKKYFVVVWYVRTYTSIRAMWDIRGLRQAVYGLSVTWYLPAYSKSFITV
jgi:hypothetical protein